MFGTENMLGFLGITIAAILEYLFWAAVAAALSWAVSQLTYKRQKITSPDPDVFNMPTVRQGTEYTINFGTNWIENPVTAWWGDTNTTAIRDHYYENKWGNQKRVYYTVGYNYAAGFEFVITQGSNDGIKQVKCGERLAWPNPDDITEVASDGATQAVIDEGNLFGGRKNGGGVIGTISFQYGASDQQPNSYLLEKQGANISASRGLTRAICEQIVFGEYAVPRPFKFLVKRTAVLTNGDEQWYVGKATINTFDMNPAHILRECYTNTEWGFGYDAALFDADAWEDAADTLYTENFGLSLKWEGQTRLGEFVNEVLRHIDAAIFQHPVTGKFILKLIREDYVVGDLIEYSTDDIVELEEYGIGVVHESPNYTWLQYWDRVHNKPIILPDYNLALMYMQGNKIAPYTVTYNGIMDGTLARTVLARERKLLSSFPITMTIKAKRTMSALLPGDVFKLAWPPKNIEQMLIRVLSVNLGTMQDGIITLRCMQDVFGVAGTVFAQPPESQWQDPRNQPAAATDRLLMEDVYWNLYLSLGSVNLAALSSSSGFLIVAAAAPTTDSLDYELQKRDSPTAAFEIDGRGAFTPNGILGEYLPKNAEDAVIDLDDAYGLSEVAAGDYCIIDDEILKVKSVAVASSQVTLARGCLDTVPEYHSGGDSGTDGARVWFIGTNQYQCGQVYSNGDQPGVKILPRTGLGQLVDDTAYNADTFNSRMIRPYPPGNFKINSVSYPETFSGQPTISWAHRDRTQQLSGITEHSDVSVGPEGGTTYTLKIYSDSTAGSQLLRTESGLTGTSYTYSEEDEMNDSGLGTGDLLNSSLRFVLTAVRGGYESWQSYDLTVNRV